MRLGRALVCVLMALMVMDLALGEEAYEEPKEALGMRFEAQQAISGNGIMSSYRCFHYYPLVLQSHSSGSGSYSSDSSILAEDITVSNIKYEEYSSSTQRINFNDSVRAAYLPTTIDLQGSARFGPIKSTWSDSTRAGNRGGEAIRARFDHANALVKETRTKISGLESLETIQNSAGSFEASMELNSAFNGTAQLSVITKDPDKRAPTTNLDELYMGTFSMAKTMKLVDKKIRSEEEDDWQQCCINGYASLPTYYKRGTYGFGSDVKGVFDCTCFKTSVSAEFQRAY